LARLTKMLGIIQLVLHGVWRLGDIMVSVLDSGLSGPGLSLDKGHCVVS